MTKRYIKVEENIYRKRLRDSKRIEELKPLIRKANTILKHTKVGKNIGNTNLG